MMDLLNNRGLYSEHDKGPCSFQVKSKTEFELNPQKTTGTKGIVCELRFLSGLKMFQETDPKTSTDARSSVWVNGLFPSALNFSFPFWKAYVYVNQERVGLYTAVEISKYNVRYSRG